jgi:transcription elongation factor Elf1
MAEKNLPGMVDKCPVCGKSCTLEMDPYDNKLAFATCQLCNTKWRRREDPTAEGKSIYEKWVHHKGAEVTVGVSGVSTVKGNVGDVEKWEQVSKPSKPVKPPKPPANKHLKVRVGFIAVGFIIIIVILSLFLSGGFNVPIGPSPTPTPTFNGVSTSTPTVNPSGTIDFVPKGIAQVLLNDGTALSVPANCFVYVNYNSVINGLLNNNSEIVTFDKMKSFTVQGSSIIATMTDNSIMNLTSLDYSYSYDHLTYTFMAPTSSGVHNWAVDEVKQVKFDFSSEWKQSVPLATVTTRSGEQFKAPAAMMVFVQGAAGMGPSYSLHLGLNTEIGNVLPFSQIKRFELTTTGYKPPVVITTTDGKTLNTTMRGDTYYYSYFCGINNFGIFKLSMENDLKSIDFG